MGNFILAVLIPLPCDDPVDYVEGAMKPYSSEGSRTDGWRLLELQWSKRMDATPSAYLAPDGSWHGRAEGAYPEEEIHSQQLHTIASEHLAQYGFSHFDLLRQHMDEVPEPVTNWHREWKDVTHKHMYIVAFVWCHC